MAGPRGRGGGAPDVRGGRGRSVRRRLPLHDAERSARGTGPHDLLRPQRRARHLEASEPGRGDPMAPPADGGRVAEDAPGRDPGVPAGPAHDRSVRAGSAAARHLRPRCRDPLDSHRRGHGVLRAQRLARSVGVPRLHRVDGLVSERRRDPALHPRRPSGDPPPRAGVVPHRRRPQSDGATAGGGGGRGRPRHRDRGRRAAVYVGGGRGRGTAQSRWRHAPQDLRGAGHGQGRRGHGCRRGGAAARSRHALFACRNAAGLRARRRRAAGGSRATQDARRGRAPARRGAIRMGVDRPQVCGAVRRGRVRGGDAMIFAVLTLGSFALLAYAYVGYPGLLWLLSKIIPGRPRRSGEPAEWPRVSIIVSAYNEEHVIADRLQNLHALDYPRDRFDVVIGSDGSTDLTTAIVEARAGDMVHLVAFPHRRGKASVLNDLVERASGDVVVLTDANPFFYPDAVRALVTALWRHPTACAVVGRLDLRSPVATGNLDGTYWRYETWIKTLESHFGAVLGANGAIYAFDRARYRRLPPPSLLGDFLVPMLLRLPAGGGVFFLPGARAYEKAPPQGPPQLRRR